jgi:tetratricopeptide (TPR) repeat protein
MSRKHLHLAKLAWVEGDRERAVRLFAEGRRAYPDFSDAQGRPRFAHEHLQLLLNTGYVAEARRLAAELVQEAGGGEPPRWVDYAFATAVDALDREERAATWARLAEASPGDMELQSQALQHALKARDRGAAARYAQRLAEAGQLPALDAVLQTDLGEALHLHLHLEAARACLKRAVAGAPDRARPRFALAAVLSDAGDLEGARAAFEAGAARLGVLPPPTRALLDYASRRWPLKAQPTPPKPSVEIMIFTHVSGKLERNAHLAAPGAGLIQETFASIQSVLKPDDCPVTVFYDRRPTETDAAYETALKSFCKETGAALVSADENGLRRQWLAAAARARADVVFFVEHDWSFRTNCPPVSRVKRLFRDAPEVSYLRLNKHWNRKVKGHPSPYPSELQDRGPLCRIPEFLNQPHFIRREVLNELIVPLIADNDAQDGQNDRAGGVEETVNVAYGQAEKFFGLSFATRLFGTFVWGPVGDEKRIIHLGC